LLIAGLTTVNHNGATFAHTLYVSVIEHSI